MNFNTSLARRSLRGHGGLPAAALLITILISGPAGVAASESALPDDLTALSIQQLIDIDITTVAKKAQKLSRVPAAIYVITQEDIRRSGATSIPEVLRMVPGLQVARINANTWAITSRGFAGRWANKLLVLMDGRTVYSPVFAGVYWDVQDTMLEDIDRIEVIRGPGATMWGANAVNGVINIVTLSAKETQGGVLTAGGGTEERGFGALRYGGAINTRAHYRAYAKYSNHNHLTTDSGTARDGWDQARGGFRMDWDLSQSDGLRIQGDIYGGRTDETLRLTTLQPPYSRIADDTSRPSGGNALVHWKHVWRNGAESNLQFYADRSQRSDIGAGENVSSYDIDAQHRFTRISKHDIQVGVDGRFTAVSFTLRPDRLFKQEPFGDALAGVFIQDEITLSEDRLALVAGAKLEHYGYTGHEFQPSVQLVWTPSAKSTLWASLSRAARIPLLVERDSQLDVSVFPGPMGLPTVLTVLGNRNLKPESLRAHELGYRVNVNKRVLVDLAGFYNVYHDLTTSEPGAPVFQPGPVPFLLLPVVAQNELAANTHGAEAAVTWQPVQRWKLSTGYSWLQVRLHPSAASRDPEVHRIEKDSPEHQFNFRSYVDLPRNSTFDTMIYYTGDLPAHTTGMARPAVPSYTRLDTRIACQPAPRLELSAGIQDLLNGPHLEFIDLWGSLANSAETGRRAYGRITLRF